MDQKLNINEYGEKLSDILVVLPTIRSLDNCLEWSRVFEQHNVTLVVVQDGEKNDIKIPIPISQACKEIHLIRWKDIDLLLKEDSWIISRLDSAIRCFGWLWASANDIQFDYVFTFDDDTKPITPDHLTHHLNNLESTVKTSMYNTIPRFVSNDEFYPRGLLGTLKKVVISHGLWLTVPDFDAESQIKLGNEYNWNLPEFKHEIPKGISYPMCGMNLMFRKELAPAMYFGLMGSNPKKESWGIGRWDDMFAGWVSKLWIDYIDAAVITGTPFCDHIRLSDPSSNLKKESLWKDEALMEILDQINLLNMQRKIKGNTVYEYYYSLFESTKSQLKRMHSKKKSIQHFLLCLEASVIFAGKFE